MRNDLRNKDMRLSLRALLAFEDNIFDAEHRLQLERTIPNHDNAASTLRRIRNVVRQPHLGVPGIVDNREELDPNLMAEYLDHQLAAEQVDKFEAYCLSSDTYLAEVATVHQILSNVLGEPARTSRDCRLRCYDIGCQRLETTTFTVPYQTATGTHFEYSPPSTETTSATKPDRDIGKPTSSKKQLTPWLLVLILVLILGSFLYWHKHQENKGKVGQLPRQVKDAEREMSNNDTTKNKPNPTLKPEAILEPPKDEKKPTPKLEVRPEPPKDEKKPTPKSEATLEPSKGEKEPTPKSEPLKDEPKPALLPEVSKSPLLPVPVSDIPEAVTIDPSSVDPFLGPSAPSASSSGFSSIGASVETSTSKPTLPPAPPSTTAPALVPEVLEPNLNNNETASDWSFTPQSVESPNPLRGASSSQEASEKQNSLLFDAIPLEVQTSQANQDVPLPAPIIDPATTESPSPIDFPERPRIAFQRQAAIPPADAPEPVSLEPTVWNTVTSPASPPSSEIVQAQDAWGKPNSLQYPTPRGSEIRSTRYDEALTPDQALTTITFGETVPFVAEQENTTKPPSTPVMGKLLGSTDPVVLFAASSASEQWKKSGDRIPLHVDQYLLSITPFRANIELGGKFRIEMVGDTKLCIIPPDPHGNPGIFVDYGRIVIRSLSNSAASLRIQTEKTSGLATLGGRSVLFIDTFAEIVPTIPEPNVPLANATVKNNAILGLLPAPTESTSWLAENDVRPFTTNAQTSILLEKGRSDRGAIRNLPNWLQPTPLSDEDKMLAEICQQAFDKTKGNCEKALELLSQSPSVPVRSFANRLWGDLGRFDVPLLLLARSVSEDEPVRQILVPYFREVMKRDAETVQRLADAIDTVRR